jgi:hypothetical protein
VTANDLGRDAIVASDDFDLSMAPPPAHPFRMMRRSAARACMALMSEVPTRRVLVVANLTESTPRLLEEVERRARGGCDFTLTVPPERHPDAPDWPPEDALELVRRAAKGRPVELVDCGADAAATIGDLVEQGTCDEILLSTPPEHHPHWHRHGLPKQIQALGIPVTVIPPDPTGWSYSHGFPDDWVRTEIGPLT